MPRRSLKVSALSIWALALLCLTIAGPAAAQQLSQRAAMMQGLDKVTARVSTFPLEVDRPARFGTLEITLRACHKRPPEEPPESAAFLEIRELRLGEQPRPLFSGWMFASSPALNPLQHPVYDVWVLECRQG
ncbi:MAG: DUF2155 domain-containing protein [Rhodospirillaceae bacterium]|nr:DUF2155 domain-containing protein [Rhodospirillaceae bacterium]